MSYLNPFNFTFVPTSTFPSGFGQVPYNINAPPSQPQQTSGFGNHNRFASNPPQNPYPLPESISQNYPQDPPKNPQQSYTDYYGNPSVQDTYSQQTNLGQNFETYQQPQPQPVRKRRPKNRANRTPPALTYGEEHLQSVQNFNYQQQQQHLPAQHVNLLGPSLVRVTPIQGPIYAKDGHLPVVPLYSYNAVKNGTLYQIPILWTALSYALGLEIHGEILRGLPCIKRLNQLFCPTAGNTYPLDNIERFIDENKALIKRMYGEFVMNTDGPGAAAGSGPGSGGGNALRRSAREVYEHEVAEFFGKAQTAKLSPLAENLGHGESVNGTESVRGKRQTVNPKNGGPTQQPKSNRVDSCESSVEITTPYWAANSAGKVRAIVNTQHFEQAIQQEVCSKTSTKHCVGNCGCEQKYKWHRLLAYDPDNDCRGIFMDWFLFPSCCVCRCNP